VLGKEEWDKGRKGPRPQTSIKMEPEVAEYLARRAELMPRDRMFLINAIA
jgi:hypothetical protein